MEERTIGVRRDNLNLGPKSFGVSAAPGKSENSSTNTRLIKMLDFFITFSLGAIFFGLPLFFTGITYQGLVFDKQIYFYFWLLLALVLWVVKAALLAEMKIRRTPLDIPIGIFLLVYVLSTIFSVDRWHSFWGFFGDPSRGLLSVIALILAYYLMFSHFNQKRFYWVFGALIVSGFFLSLWTFLGIFNVKFVPDSFARIAPLSPLGSITGLGVFFSLIIPLMMSAVFKLAEWKATWKKKASIGALVFFIFFDFFLLFSISPYFFSSRTIDPSMGLLVGISFFLVYVLAKIIQPAKAWAWLPMAAFAVILAILMLGTVDNEIRFTRANLPIEVSPNTNLSFDVVKESLKEKFLLGSGPGNYGYSFSLHKPQEFNLGQLYNIRFYQGSGMFFEAVPTLGILGTVGLILVILTFLGVAIYLLSREKEKNKILSLGALSASLIFLIDAMIVRMEGSILLLGVLAGALTLFIITKESQSREEYLNLSLKASPKFALTMAFIFMLVISGAVFVFLFLGRVFVADAKAGLAVRSQKISEEGSISKLISSAKLYNKEGRYFSRLAQEYMYLANQEVAKGEKERDVNRITGYLTKSIAFATQGRNLMSKDVTANEVLAQIYENAGIYVPESMSSAEENYNKTMELDPYNPNFYLRLGQIKISLVPTKKEESEKKKLVEEAKELFQKSIDKKSDFDAGYYNLALTQEALGDVEGAIENIKKALVIKQRDLNYNFYLAKLYQNRGKEEDLKQAENIFKAILQADDKQINVHFSLGMLYEKQNKDKEAIAEYEKVSGLLPDTEGNRETRVQVQKMISNVRNGIENNPENLKVSEQQSSETPPTPENTSIENSNSVPSIQNPTIQEGQTTTP